MSLHALPQSTLSRRWLTQKGSVLRKGSAQDRRGVVWRAATGGMRAIEESVDECLETGHGADSRLYLEVFFRSFGAFWGQIAVE